MLLKRYVHACLATTKVPADTLEVLAVNLPIPGT